MAYWGRERETQPCTIERYTGPSGVCVWGGGRFAITYQHYKRRHSPPFIIEEVGLVSLDNNYIKEIPPVFPNYELHASVPVKISPNIRSTNVTRLP